jgi:hypothetical protein
VNEQTLEEEYSIKYATPWYSRVAGAGGDFTPVAEGWYQSY